jgi:hypothetical protein
MLRTRRKEEDTCLPWRKINKRIVQKGERRKRTV